MRVRFLTALAAGVLALSGCDKDVTGTPVQLPSAAFVRYVNAVPDTSALDFRFVDGSIEGSPQFANVEFRQFTAYQRVRVGARTIRVFTNASPYNNSAAVATQQHLEVTRDLAVKLNEAYGGAHHPRRAERGQRGRVRAAERGGSRYRRIDAHGSERGSGQRYRIPQSHAASGWRAAL